jgi:hypothetical protein
MVTSVPTGPAVGLKLVTSGATSVTVNVSELRVPAVV